MKNIQMRSLVRDVRKVLARATVAAIAAGLLTTSIAAAELNGALQRFDIPAQNASDALNQFSKQTGLRLLFSFEALQGLRTAAVQGEFTAQDVLDRLLAGSNLSYEVTADSVVVIRTKSQQTGASAEALPVLETVNVFGTLDNEIGVGSKSGLTLRETPKSVTIVTRERIEAQNLTTVTDVLTQATGITVRPYDPVQAWYYSRGYRVNSTQLDGGAPITGDFGNFSSPDSAMFERVEVLRGVDGMFSGAGDPGGVINLVRKRALASPALNVSASVGSWNNYRAEVDATGAIALDGKVRGRVVGVFADKNYFWDRADSNKKVLYGVVEGDLGADTVVSLGGSFENRKENGYWYGGVPRYTDGGDLHLRRSTSLAPGWGFIDITTSEVFAKLQHSLTSSIDVAFNLTHQWQTSHSLTAYTNGAVNRDGNMGPIFNAWANDTPSKRTALDLYAKGTFQLFGREHKFAVGGDYSVTDGGGARFFYTMQYPYFGAPAVDVFAFDPGALPKPVRELNPAAFTNRISPVSGQTQYGAYLTVGLQLADPLQLTLGGRFTQYHQEEKSYRLQLDGSAGPFTSYYTPIYDESAFVPSAALTYEINANWTAYASYAQTFRPQAGLLKAPEPGTPLDPITGDGYELGVKGEIFGHLNAAVALYSVQRIGEGLEDPAYEINYGQTGSACCYIDTGDITMRGVDIEVSGVVRRGWQMFAGYTYGQQVFGSTSEQTDAAMSFHFSPKHLFKMWTTWQLPGAASAWTLNAGVTAQSSIKLRGVGPVTDSAGNFSLVPYQVVQNGYALWNASAEYRVNDNWSAALYVDNLFDKTYYAAINSPVGGNIYGAPRSFTLRLLAKF